MRRKQASKAESRKRSRMWGAPSEASNNPNGKPRSSRELKSRMLAESREARQLAGGGSRSGKRVKLSTAKERLSQLETNLAVIQDRKFELRHGRVKPEKLMAMKAEAAQLRQEVALLEGDVTDYHATDDPSDVPDTDDQSEAYRPSRINAVQDIRYWKEQAQKEMHHDMSIFEDFEILEKLGEGTYGVVTKARHTPSGTIVALKKVKLEMEEEGIPATTIREVSLLKRVRHPNIVTLFECIFNVGNLHLVFEFIPKDMHKYLSSLDEELSGATVQKWMADLFSGIDFCHMQGILHRDLKPQNILVCGDNTLKIADFGLGREVGIPLLTLTHEVVTLWYRCPEILLGFKKYGTGVDTWSLGCIMAELLSRKPGDGHQEWGPFLPLFAGDCEIDQLFKIFQMCGTPTEEIWQGITGNRQVEYNAAFPRWDAASKEAWAERVPRAGILALDLIKRCIAMDPSERLVPKSALKHPYFTAPASLVDTM